MLDRELYIFVEGFVTDVFFSKLCGKKKVVFVVQSKMAAAGEAEATFFFCGGLLRSEFGPLPHRHHKPRVDSLDFRSSSWMECLPRGFCRIFSSFDSVKAEVQGLFSALIYLFTN